MIQKCADKATERVSPTNKSVTPCDSGRLPKLADAVGISSADVPPQEFWFIAVVTPNTEKSCEKKLKALFKKEQLSFECYVPLQRELHEWPSTGKRVWVDRVLCPCYLFIRCSEQVRYRLACQAPFILYFLMDRARNVEGGRNDFARIPDVQMLHFKRMVGDAETPVTIDTALLHAGSKVRVKAGRFAGLEGVLEKDSEGSTNLAIRVDFLGYAKMAFPIELLEQIT